ncbi:MAG: hypothetical protein HOA76_01425 [Gammaproteobacteria bacterium]|nr:hypothetical protein [Gammaproteobacteria bacterium]
MKQKKELTWDELSAEINKLVSEGVPYDVIKKKLDVNISIIWEATGEKDIMDFYEEDE